MPDNERFLGEGPGGKPHFDLEAYVVARLAAAGVRRIEASGLDTYALEDRFYSYPPRHPPHRTYLWAAAQFDWARQLARFTASG